MSELLSAAAQVLGAPEAIVQRSAAARAQATGTSVDDVLSAWAGGQKVAAATPTPPTSPAPAPDEVAEAASEPQPGSETAQDIPAAPAPAAVAVASPLVEAPEETVEPVPLRIRVRRVGRIGALVGAALGVLVVVAAAPWLASGAILIGEEGSLTPAVEVVAGWAIAGHALLSLVVGALLAGVTRAVAGRIDRGMRLVSSRLVTAVAGGIVGAAMGALTAAVVLSFGQASEITEGATVVPVLAGLGWSVLGWALTGWVVGAVGQVFGVPHGIAEDEAAAMGEVRHRMSSAVGIPLVVVVSILGLVLPLAFVFINFPQWAPLLGIFVAVSILGFAGISASKPGIKISAREFLVAILGVATVLVMIVAVLAAQGGEHANEAAEGALSVFSSI